MGHTTRHSAAFGYSADFGPCRPAHDGTANWRVDRFVRFDLGGEGYNAILGGVEAMAGRG